MNTTKVDPFTQPNYPFLSGYLQSEMLNLASNHKFLNMESHFDRMDYIQKLINEAKAAAIKYETSIGN
jgi:hypothetical protein